jgi:hypothetical protein
MAYGLWGGVWAYGRMSQAGLLKAFSLGEALKGFSPREKPSQVILRKNIGGIGVRRVRGLEARIGGQARKGFGGRV